MKNIRLQFKELIQEIDYQEKYSYEKRTEIFNRYAISVSTKYVNPLMLLSTLLLNDGSNWQYGNGFHGVSHSGAVKTAFNEQIEKNTSPYVKVENKGSFDWVKIFHYDYNGKTKWKVKMQYILKEDSIAIKFFERDFSPNPSRCYYEIANEFLTYFGFEPFFKHIIQIRKNEHIKNNYVWDGINSQLEGFDTIKECEEYITDTCIDESEGIHPDIESMIIMKPVREVLVNEYKDNYKVEFKNI